MIDPITALAGIQSAVALIKKVSKTVDDVSSLGPVLGKYFDAKHTATKAAVEAKSSGKKSAMAVAIEIEMALHQTEQFEKELQLLFMQTGKIDVWNKIKSRAMAMDVESAHQARREKENQANRKRQQQEFLEWSLAFIIIVAFSAATIWGLVEIVDLCKTSKCGV